MGCPFEECDVQVHRGCLYNDKLSEWGEVGQEKQSESHKPGSKPRGPGEGLSNFTRSFPGEQNSWCFASTE